MLLVSWHQEIMRTGDTTQHQKEGDTDSHSWKDRNRRALEIQWSGTKYRDRRCQDKSSGCTGVEGLKWSKQNQISKTKKISKSMKKTPKVLSYFFKQGVVNIRSTRRHTTELGQMRGNSAEVYPSDLSFSCAGSRHILTTPGWELHLGKMAAIRKPAWH